MRISFKSSTGELFEDCLRFGRVTENEQFVDALLSRNLSFWQLGDCENKFHVLDHTNTIQQQLDIYRHEDLGYLLRLSRREDYPTRMFYALNDSHPTNGVGVIHLDGNGLIYPAELFHPSESVKSVLLDLVNFPLMQDRNPGVVTWIGTDCISGTIKDEPPHQYYMQFAINRDKLSLRRPEN